LEPRLHSGPNKSGQCFETRGIRGGVKEVIMEYGVPQNVQSRLWPSAEKQKLFLTWQGGADAVWRATGKVRGWFDQLNGKQGKREFDFCEERRLERLRIAGELHDTLLQGFLGASLIVGVTLQNMSEGSPGTASLRRAAELMQRAIEEGRGVLQGLRSSPVTFDSLEQAFTDLLREVPPPTGTQARIVVIGRPRALKAEIQREIYLIGREALVNALRHANATAIEVEVGYLRNHLRVVIRDNGCGIDEQILRSGRTSHWGLLGMRERAKEIGGELQIYSRAGAGTEVELSVPSDIAAVS
jgi:signal transduction histidine kinase